MRLKCDMICDMIYAGAPRRSYQLPVAHEIEPKAFRGGPFYFRGGGGGEWKTIFAQHFFSHWPVFLFTVKAVQDIFFSNLPPPPPHLSKVKWSAPYKALLAAAIRPMRDLGACEIRLLVTTPACDW